MILLIPLLLVDVPPISDYPAHLARIIILSDIDNNHYYQEFFSPHWSIIPNIGIDILMVPIIKGVTYLTGYSTIAVAHIVGKLVLMMIVVLSVVAPVVYSHVIFKKKLMGVPFSDMENVTLVKNSYWTF